MDKISSADQNATSTLPSHPFATSIRRVWDKNILAFVMIVLAATIIYARDTRYFSQPRFWAEEGSLHFAYSFTHSWWKSLIEPQVGYLNFWPNLATWIAAQFPLETAPLITTLMSFFVQLVPVALILFSNSPFWNGWIRKIAGIAILFFTPLTSEGWLNSINSYTYFGIITFLILLEEIPFGAIRSWVYRVLLLLGGLSGTLSCFLIPLFFFRALEEKKKERLVQLLILSACAVVQILLIFSYQATESFGQRLHLIGLTTFGVTMWTQGFALFIFGFNQVHEWARTLFSLATQDLASFQMWGRLLLVAGTALLFLLSTNLPRKLRWIFLSSYLILMLLPMMFSVIKDKYALIDTGLHQRIFLAPNVILGWMMLKGIQFSKERSWRASFSNLVSILSILIIGASLFWGFQTYRERWSVAEYWPDWKTEVATWRTNPEYPLRIQPEGWVIRLPKH